MRTEGIQIQNGILISYTGREEALTIPEGVHTIGEGALKGCASLKKVILPQSLRRILGGAFKGCRKLEAVEIPPAVCEIGAYAFHRCHALEAIFLPPGVEALGDCAFLYCDSLEEVSIPGVRRLGNQCFVNDVKLKKLTLSQELDENSICDVFTGCGLLADFTFADGRHFEIPNPVEVVAGKLPLPGLIRKIVADVLRMMELDGKTMVQFLTNLKQVEIPEGVEKIGKSAFFDKRGVLSVKLPGSLREIESRAFRNCISLETVIFEGAGPVLHEDAFKNCTSLKYILTSDGIRHELRGIARPSGPQVPELVKNIHRQVLGNFQISGTLLLKYLGAESRVAVPEGITVIGEEAFAGNETIDRVILPDSLLEIGSGAFRDCALLQSIAFPPGLRRIGEEAFENCVKLLRIALPPKVTRLEQSAFKRCRALKEIDLGENLVQIQEQAFYQCRALERISFPESLASVGELAFFRCSSLRKVTLSANVAFVGSLAFAESGVERVQLGADGQGCGSGIFSDCTGLKRLVLKEGVRHIPDKLAAGCTALEQITCPASLASAGVSPWEKTPFLENWIQAGRKGEIFWDGRNLEGEVWLSEEVRILAGGAFYGNRLLTAVHLPEGVRWAGSRAFAACDGLRRVSWHSATDRLEAGVFAGCSELVSVEDEKGRPVVWKAVGERAFYRCGSLREVCLEQVESIGREAFRGCVSLRRPPCFAVSSGILRRVGECAFEDTGLITRSGSDPAVYDNIVLSGAGCHGELILPQGVRGIAPYAFSGNGELTKVVLPESLDWIGEGAFWGCGGLREICFPESVCEIGDRAFEKCRSLSRVRISAESLGTAAFAFCTSLTQAVLSGASLLPGRLFEGCFSLRECVCENAVQIQEYCFSGCAGLSGFNFSRIVRIAEYAFAGCDNLKRAVFGDGVHILPHAFEDCGRLEEICLGEESAGICLGEEPTGICLGEYAFSGCTFLGRVLFRGEEWEPDTYEDILSDKIPEKVRLIFHSAFSCFTVEGESILRGYRGAGRIVKIPEGIRRIEAEVFRDILMLEEIIIPGSVEYIGARAFHGTAWMERQRKRSPFVTVNHMLLDASCCRGEVVVPEEIKMVCGWAFANGMEIEKVRFLSGKTRVEEYAFRNCIYLREMILPDGTAVELTGIADRERELPALAMQAVTDSMNCFKTDRDHVLAECTGNISRLRIPEGITAIAPGVFQDGNLLTEVTLPGSLRSIGNRAFSGCKWLREVHQAQNVEEIGSMAFFNCGALVRMECPEKLNRLGARAFENCVSLEEILIPEGVEEIPERAFYRCHSLKRVDLPAGIKRIGREAFAFCRELSRIRVGAEVQIEEGAFLGCGVALQGGRAE